MRVIDFIRETATRFQDAGLYYGHGTDNAADEAVYLIYASLGIDFAESPEQQTGELTEQDLVRLRALVSRRVEEQVPVAYLVEKAWFAGRPFHCDSRALVPRSPIAELIVNGFQPLLRRQPERVLDLCTGGGCIGIACALQFPASRVELADISRDCLDLAAENIALHDLAGRVQTRESDLFAALEGRFDLIVSNPPYVSEQEWSALPAEYRHEPALALLSEEQGLEIPLRILRQAGDYLHEDGLLILEVGFSAEALQARLPALPILWLDFEEGGEGVLAITARQLAEYRSHLN